MIDGRNATVYGRYVWRAAAPVFVYLFMCLESGGAYIWNEREDRSRVRVSQ